VRLLATLSTRLQIRRRVGRLPGDMPLCTATAAGSETTFTDALHLAHEPKLLLARLGLFSGGTEANLGRIVRATDNVKSTQTLTFTPAVPVATAEGDVLELWNERDEGISPALVNELIDEAIRDAAGRTPQPVTGAAQDFIADANVLAIDASWEAFTGAEWKDECGNWRKIDAADLRVDRYARTVTIDGRHRSLADQHQIRLRGANLPEALASDDAETAIDFEWITHHVAAQALGYRLEHAYDRKEVEGRLLQLQQRADAVRPKIQLTLPGRFWRLS
ncbi:MAG: hypothetical protein IT304_09050, partial [Dehalococcoidia bacterium]|nr:hypothetical protein [Dehalococcoidia bacterium]